MIKRCEMCGKEYEPAKCHSYQKYCSSKCRNRSQYLRHGEKIKERNRAYQRAHRDEINAYRHYYRQICGRQPK